MTWNEIHLEPLVECINFSFDKFTKKFMQRTLFSIYLKIIWWNKFILCLSFRFLCTCLVQRNCLWDITPFSLWSHCCEMTQWCGRRSLFRCHSAHRYLQTPGSDHDQAEAGPGSEQVSANSSDSVTPWAWRSMHRGQCPRWRVLSLHGDLYVTWGLFLPFTQTLCLFILIREAQCTKFGHGYGSLAPAG